MTASPSAASRSSVVFGRASGTLLALAVLVGGVMLAMGSHPAGPAGWAFLLFPLLGVISVGVWVGILIQSLIRRRLPMGLIVAPLLGVFVVGLVWTGVATDLRFRLLDRPAFHAVVARAPAPVITLPDRDLTSDESYGAFNDFPGPCPAWIGTIRVAECRTFAAGYLFFDNAGSGLIDDGGVAFMPAGVPAHDVGNGSFESPQFVHLVGPWYAFTSSW